MSELFTDQVKTEQATNDQQVANPAQTSTSSYDDLLKSITNEQGNQKFSSVEDVIEGYKASQDFINTLMQEKRQKEQEALDLAAKVRSQEELAELLRTRQPESDPQPEAPVAPAAPSLTQDDVLTILQEQKEREVQTANVKKVQEACKEAFGNDFMSKLKEAVASKGLSDDLASQMAKTSPDALLSFIGVEGKKADPLPVNSTVNTRQFSTKTEDGPARVMGGVTGKTLLSEWEKSKQRTLAKLEG